MSSCVCYGTLILKYTHIFHSHYCSQECQKVDWKNGHKQQCPVSLRMHSLSCHRFSSLTDAMKRMKGRRDIIPHSGGHQVVQLETILARRFLSAHLQEIITKAVGQSYALFCCLVSNTITPTFYFIRIDLQNAVVYCNFNVPSKDIISVFSIPTFLDQIVPQQYLLLCVANNKFVTDTLTYIRIETEKERNIIVQARKIHSMETRPAFICVLRHFSSAVTSLLPLLLIGKQLQATAFLSILHTNIMNSL